MPYCQENFSAISPITPLSINAKEIIWGNSKEEKVKKIGKKMKVIKLKKKLSLEGWKKKK